MQAIVASFEETCLTLLLWLAAVGVILGPGKDLPGAIYWSGVLFIQSLPYIASLVMALINAVPLHRHRAVSRPRCAGSFSFLIRAEQEAKDPCRIRQESFASADIRETNASLI